MTETGPGGLDLPARVRARIERLRALVARPGTPGERAAAEHALRGILDRYAPAVELDALELSAGYVYPGGIYWIGSRPFARDAVLTRLRPGPGTSRSAFTLLAVEIREPSGAIRHALLERGRGLLAAGRTEVAAGESIEVRFLCEHASACSIVLELEEGRVARLERALLALGGGAP